MQEKKVDLFCMFVLGILIFITSSFSATSDLLPSMVSIAIWIGLIALIALKNSKLKRINIYYYFIPLIACVLSAIINNQAFFRIVRIAFAITVAFLINNTYSSRVLKKTFVKLMELWTVISVPFYLVCVFSPQLLSSFIMRGTGDRLYYNLYFFSHNVGAMGYSGLFWEPGVCATFLNIALALTLFNAIDCERRMFRIILFTTMVLFSFSTTGYVCLALVYLIFVQERSGSKWDKFVTVLLGGVLVFLVFNQYGSVIFGDNGRSTFGKISRFINNDGFSNYNMLSSSTIRYFSITKPFEIFLSHPLFGVGYTRLQEMTLDYTKGAITCTFTNWYGIYGIIYGLFMTIGFIKLSKKDNQNWWTRALMCLFLFLLVISEDFSSNAFFIAMAMMGHLSRYEEVFVIGE